MAGWRDRKIEKPQREPQQAAEPKPTTPRARSGWRAATAPKSVSGQHWKEARTRKTPSLRRLKLAGFLLLFVALVASLVAYLLNYPVSVPFIALTPAAYEHPLPALPLVREDLDRFKDVLGRSHQNVVFHSTESQLRSPNDFLTELAYRFKQVDQPGGPSKDVVMLYLRAHGVVNKNGDPCLLLPDSNPLDESTWLPLTKIVEIANQWDADSKYRKLLLIDAGGQRRFWPAGVLHNAFVSRLEALVNSQSKSRIAVIHSADVGQTSHAAPEIKGTTFAYYLAEGIRGDADANADDEITLHELHEYVRRQVTNFAHRRRADVQEPVLLPRDAHDFAVAHASKATKAEVLPLTLPSNVDFDKLWQRFAQLRQARAYSADPLSWAELEAKLVRLESLMLAGQAYASQLDQKDVAVLMGELTRAVSIDAEAASSLAIASRSIDHSAWNHARAQVEQWKKSIGTDKPLPIPQFSEPLASRIVWEEARQGSLNDLQRAKDILQAASDRRRVEYTEIQYLQLLATWLDGQSKTYPLLADALACCQLAEQAAGPTDPRAHYWIRDLVSQADRVQDEAFDGMLTGAEESPRHVSTALGQLAGTNGSYEQAKQIGELISRAYRLRDEAWSTIPHLAAWVDSEAWLDGAGVQTHGQARSERFTPTLTKLIEATHQLADALDRLPANLNSLDQAKRQLDQSINVVEVGLESLLAAFDEKCSTLLNDETFQDDERTMRQITAVLQLPLIPNDNVSTRTALRDRLLRHRGAAYSVAASTRSEAKLGEVRDDSSYIKWLTNQDAPHGLATLDNDLLDPEAEGLRAGGRVDGLAEAATSASRIDRLVKLETEMRARLAQVKSSATKLAAANISGAPFDCRRGLSKADRLLRAAAPIFARRIWEKLEQDQDPIDRLTQFDQHALHLWHGARALRNWWGPADRRRPFFAESGEHQLAARAKYAELPPKGRPEIERAAYFQGRLREAILQQEQLLASWRPAIAAPGITVTSDEISHSITTLPIAGLPPGQLSVYLSGDHGLLPVHEDGREVRRRSVDVNQSVTLKHTIKDARKLKLGSLTANALFRGHQRKVDFRVDDPGQAIVVWNELSPEPPRITVRGDSKEKSQIMFVLDCSGSMREPFGGTKRLPFAIDTLKRTVRLLDESHYIGLILYGHRVSDDKKINPAAANDVEMVRTIREKNDFREQDALIAQFNDRNPTGATPLYLAIQRAIESFDRRIGGVKIVVVLTDGDNRVPEGGTDPTVADVIRSWRQSSHQPRIDIVSIADEVKRPGDLKQITGVSNGTLHTNVVAEDLAQTIEDSVGLRKFSIVDLQSNLTTDEMRLGTTWTETNYDGWNLYDVQRTYRIQVGTSTKDVLLEGGEHLDVVYNRRQRQFEFEPFLENSEQRVQIPRSNDLFAVSHYTRKDGDSQIFQVSVQNQNRDFSPRPRQVWAEITPLGFAANQNVFYAFDCDFKMKTPVPLFQFRIRNWPGSETAKIKVWFRYDDSIPDEQQFPVPLDRPTTIPWSQGSVSLTAKTQRLATGENVLVIVETHNAESNDYPLRVRLIPPAKKTEHRMFSEFRRVHHVFSTGDQTSVRVGVSSKSGMRSGWHETEQFDVLLPNR